MYPLMVRLVYCDQYNGTLDIQQYIERGFPADYNLKQVVNDVE